MGRWLVALMAVAVAGAAGLAVGFWLWGQSAQRLPSVESRAESLQREVSVLEAKGQDLERRVEQITREQERLAQENALLRTQRTTEQLLSEQSAGQPTPLPTLPPK